MPFLSASQLRLWLESTAGLRDAIFCGAIAVWTILKFVKGYKIDCLAFSALVSVEKSALASRLLEAAGLGPFVQRWLAVD